MDVQEQETKWNLYLNDSSYYSSYQPQLTRVFLVCAGNVVVDLNKGLWYIFLRDEKGSTSWRCERKNFLCYRIIAQFSPAASCLVP